MHWYHLDANVVARRFEPKKADGSPYLRITRKMAKEANAVLGVTDILSHVGNIGGLINYTAKLSIEAARMTAVRHIITAACRGHYSAAHLAAGILKVLNHGTFEREAMEAYKESSHVASDRGTLMHDWIRTYLQHGELPADPVGHNACQSARTALAKLGCEDLTYEVCFVADVKGMRFGGTPDATGKNWVIDWKTTTKTRMPRDKELAQLAAYRLGLGKPKARCADVYISQETGALESIEEWTSKQLKWGLDYFREAYKVCDMVAEGWP